MECVKEVDRTGQRMDGASPDDVQAAVLKVFTLHVEDSDNSVD